MSFFGGGGCFFFFFLFRVVMEGVKGVSSSSSFSLTQHITHTGINTQVSTPTRGILCHRSQHTGKILIAVSIDKINILLAKAIEVLII